MKNRRRFLQELTDIFGPQGVLHTREELLLYEYDAGANRALPEAVVFPTKTEDVVRAVRLAARYEMPLVARGAGTGLSGGAIPESGGLLIVTSRMKKIISIDLPNFRAVVEPGLVNLDLTEAVEGDGYFYAPDPSSQKACTIGGNVAENAGGPHTLAYGVTVNHVIGLEVVLPTGELVEIGGYTPDIPGYDLTGLMVGSEGTLAIVTKITVRLMRKPEAVETLLAIYDTVDDACRSVSSLTAKGITPAACEMLDKFCLRCVEEATHAGYPLDAEAVLLIELEGLKEAVEAQAGQVEAVCHQHSAREVRRAKSGTEREKLWQGRKNAFGAMGRVSPNYYTQDGVIPRTKLPETLRAIYEITTRYGLQVGNVFHAGDGNLHPAILFDARDEEQFRKVIKASNEMMRLCIRLGGSITGEHGVGLEKRDLMPELFSANDLAAMASVRDVFNPTGCLNPGKLLPSSKSCGELRLAPTRNTSSTSGTTGASSSKQAEA